MTDDELDAMLDGARAPELDPTFVARTRTRVDGEHVPGRFGSWRWTAVPAALTLAAVSIAAVLNWPVEPRRLDTSSVGPGTGHTATAPIQSASRVPGSSGLRPAGVQQPVEVHAERQSPRPVFAASDRAAFAWLLAYSQSSAMPPLDVRLEEIHIEETSVAPLDVPALEVPALVLTDVIEGEPR